MASPPTTLIFTNGSKKLTFDSPGFQTKQDLETIGYSGSPYILIEDEREWYNLVQLYEEFVRWEQDFENKWSLLNDPATADDLYHTNDRWVRDPRMVRMFKWCLWNRKTSYQDSRDPLVCKKLRADIATAVAGYKAFYPVLKKWKEKAEVGDEYDADIATAVAGCKQFYPVLKKWKKKAEVGDKYEADPLVLRGHPKSCFWPPEREWRTIEMVKVERERKYVKNIAMISSDGTAYPFSLNPEKGQIEYKNETIYHWEQIKLAKIRLGEYNTKDENFLEFQLGKEHDDQLSLIIQHDQKAKKRFWKKVKKVRSKPLRSGSSKKGQEKREKTK